MLLKRLNAMFAIKRVTDFGSVASPDNAVLFRSTTRYLLERYLSLFQGRTDGRMDQPKRYGASQITKKTVRYRPKASILSSNRDIMDMFMRLDADRK